MKYVGVDIGGTKCAVSKIEVNSDRSFEVLEKIIFPAPEELDVYISLIEKNLLVILDAECKAVGISCGGPLNSKKGIVLNPPNLPDWINVPIVEILSEICECPVYLQNDANAGALAEWIFGKHFDKKNLVFCTFGTGMGAGLILNGKLYEGTNDMAGEIGHIRLAEDGPIGFGKAGSFEGFASGGGLSNHSELASGNRLTAKHLFERYEENDLQARAIIEKSMSKLGLGLAILIDILNPEVIILGSLYQRQKDIIDKYMYPVLKEEALTSGLECCEIIQTSLGEKIGDLAAVAVAYYALNVEEKEL